MSSTLTSSMSTPFRFRDVLVVGFLVAAIFHCYYQPLSHEYSLEPIWFVETFDTTDSREKPSQLIPPIVMDIDKDNVKDLISVGVDNVLRVSRIGIDGGASHSHVVHAEEFLRKHMTNEVLALTGGCCYRRTVSASEHSLDHFLAVVGRDKEKGLGMGLQLLDASLMTLWEVPLLSAEETAALSDCEVHVSARLVPRSDEDDDDVTMLLVSLHSELEQCASRFLLKAFDTQSGRQLWSHSTGQAQAQGEQKPIDKKMTHLRFGNHPYYERVQRILMGGGSDDSTSWTKFRSSFMRQLPHHWRDGRDDKLLLAFFGKGKVLLRHDVTSSSSVTGRRNYAKRAGVSAVAEGKKPPVTTSRSRGLPNPATMPTMRKTSARGGAAVTSGKGKGKGILKIDLMPLLTNTSSASSSPPLKSHPSSHHLNVAVFHGSDGIRVIGLQTGELLAFLPLQRDVFYADVNHDGNIDSLYFDTSDFHITRDTAEGRLTLAIERIPPSKESKAVEAEAEGEEGGGAGEAERSRDMCSFAVLSGLPPHSWLFNDSQLCSSDNAYRRYHSTGGAGSRHRHQKKKKSSASTSTSTSQTAGGSARIVSVPLLVRGNLLSYGEAKSSNSGETDQHDQHILALSALYGEEEGGSSSSSEVESQRKEVLVVANNLGVINAYNRHGRLLWQQSDTTSPQRESDYVEKLSSSDATSLPRPFLLQMSALREAQSTSEHLLLYCHQKRIRLHSLKHPRERGKLLAEATSPNAIVHKPLIVDFDDDGFNDVIIITDVAILGYRLQVTPSFFPLIIPFLVAFVIAVAIFLLKLSSESTSASSSSSNSSNRRGADEVDISSMKGGATRRKKQWTLTRATDNQHID
eukprot:gene11242-12248_t